MITLTMKQLMESVEVIQKLINSSTPLSAKISYQIIRIAREVESEYNLFQKSRIELIQKYAVKDTNNKAIIVDDKYQIIPEEQEQFSKEYEELMNSSIQMNIEPLKIEEINLMLTPLEWMEIEPFVR